ncbi:MAG TPA: SPOR domain-containing protein [Candidatus Omnitrophota bacterium]|nr:SPOR domain-containing protein [Candidatus Omnitrophota bacterium]
MQTELFEMTSSQDTQEESSVPASTFLEKTFISLKIDQAIGLFLALLVFYVLTFSWGVEKGKKIVLGSQRVAQETVATQTVSEAPTPVANVPEKKGWVAGAKADVPQEVPIPVSELPKPVAAVYRPEGKFTIQHVTYLTPTIADREVQKLAKLGQPSFVIPTGKHFLVCIDSFQTRKEAMRQLKQLKMQQIISTDAYVRPLPS